MDARELLGVTYERRSQLANARAEYETYLKDFPDGPGSKRVAQRLDALVTAASEPRAKLKPVVVKKQSAAPESDVYGMLATRYYQSDAIVSDQGGIPMQSDLFTDANIAGRVETDAWRLRGDFFGSYDHDLGQGGRSDDVLIRSASVLPSRPVEDDGVPYQVDARPVSIGRALAGLPPGGLVVLRPISCKTARCMITTQDSPS